MSRFKRSVTRLLSLGWYLYRCYRAELALAWYNLVMIYREKQLYNIIRLLHGVRSPCGSHSSEAWESCIESWWEPKLKLSEPGVSKIVLPRTVICTYCLQYDIFLDNKTLLSFLCTYFHLQSRLLCRVSYLCSPCRGLSHWASCWQIVGRNLNENLQIKESNNFSDLAEKDVNFWRKLDIFRQGELEKIELSDELS